MEINVFLCLSLNLFVIIITVIGFSIFFLLNKCARQHFAHSCKFFCLSFLGTKSVSPPKNNTQLRKNFPDDMKMNFVRKFQLIMSPKMLFGEWGAFAGGCAAAHGSVCWPHLCSVWGYILLAALAVPAQSQWDPRWKPACGQSLRCQTTNFLLSHCAALELPESTGPGAIHTSVVSIQQHTSVPSTYGIGLKEPTFQHLS